MANEINAQVQLNWTNGSRSLPISKSGRFDAAGLDAILSYGTATTSGGAITLPSGIGTPGWAYFRNLDATNYIEIGNHNSGTPIYTIKLLPGEFFLGRLTMAANAINVRSNTANADYEFAVVEN